MVIFVGARVLGAWRVGMERFIEKLDHDRRLSQRYSLRAPLRVRMRKSNLAEQAAESENLSQRGVFFATDLPLNKGVSLDLLLEMPEEISGVPAAQWLCTGHVVRVVPRGSLGEKQGVGVQFDFYEVSRSERPQWAMGAGLRGPVLPQTLR
jgi:Tfp pilus assembly protein PilZ